MKTARLAWTAILVASGVGFSIAHAQEARVHGDVRDRSGNPVVAAGVVLEPVSGASGARVFTKSNNKGTFLFGLVRPGEYRLQVEAKDFVLSSYAAYSGTGPERKTLWEGTIDPANPPVLRLESGMQVDCSVVLGPALAAGDGSGRSIGTPEQVLQSVRQKVVGGDCPGALAHLNDAGSALDGSALAQYLRGFCLAQAGSNDAAVEALSKARALNPKFQGVAVLQGKVLGSMGKHAEAEVAFKQEIEVADNPQVLSDCWLGLALAQKNQGRAAESEASFKKVIELSPARPEPYAELVDSALKGGRMDDADSLLKAAAAAGAPHAIGLLNFGIQCMNRKDFARAKGAFERVIASAAEPPDLALAYALMGKLHLRDGKNRDAAEAMKKSLELDPSGRMAAETREALKAIDGK